MRDQIVAGNWKMNNDQIQTETLLERLKTYEIPNKVRVMVAPSFTQLSQSKQLLNGSSIKVAAQNMSAAPSGAYTGEVSAGMLKGIGVQIVILGHSERRALFHMEVIFCFGEELEDRKAKAHFDVVEKQLKNALFDLEASAWKKIILAYEPVWAIGTGETASPQQAQEMHAHIRNLILNHYNPSVADEVSILYGGSVKPNNAKEIFSGADVDGGLIGGASLDAEDFMAIVNAF